MPELKTPKKKKAFDHVLVLREIPVQFLDGGHTVAKAEGNNAAWRCQCGAHLIGRCYFQFGDTCRTECECGKVFRVDGDAKKKAIRVNETVS
jgi:hypothetical protein